MPSRIKLFAWWYAVVVGLSTGAQIGLTRLKTCALNFSASVTNAPSVGEEWQAGGPLPSLLHQNFGLRFLNPL